MDECRRRDEERRMCVRASLGQCLQVRQHYTGGRVEPQVGDLKVHEDIIGAVLTEHSIVDAGGVVDEDFGDANFSDGLFEGSGQGDAVGHVGRVGVDGCGGGSGGDEGRITGEIGGRAGEEGDAGEAARGEEASDVGANHRPRADDEDGSLRCHDKVVVYGTGLYEMVERERAGLEKLKGLM